MVLRLLVGKLNADRKDASGASYVNDAVRDCTTDPTVISNVLDFVVPGLASHKTVVVVSQDEVRQMLLAIFAVGE
jgi:hypothetical protein